MHCSPTYPACDRGTQRQLAADLRRGQALHPLLEDEAANLVVVGGGFCPDHEHIGDRFVGANMGFANLELRYRFFEIPGFTFNLAPLFDVGRVWDTLDSVKANAGQGYKYSYGLGLRIIWNQSTVIYAEWAKSRETRSSNASFADSNFYFNFGHIF